MKRSRPRGTTFYCFSPPVMIATCLFEVGLLVYVLFRYKLNKLTGLAVALLFFLALFQLAEYNSCGSVGTVAAEWSRIGFAAITVLPVLGIHLVQTIAGRSNKYLTWAAYGTALLWVTIFALSERTFSGHVCGGNYVIFQLKQSLVLPYAAYYYGWLIAAILLSIQYMQRAKKQVHHALSLMVLSYLVFMLPTAIANSVKPETIAGIPSILCGFAVLLAIILVFGILPTVNKKKA
jgi:hypothetical protein